MNPTDPIAAVTHRDPYPYYATLVDGPPLAFDATLGLWVASRAASVAAVLGHPTCRVRPLDAPVPPALRGTTAGALFGDLIRMNDGALRERTASLAGRRLRAPLDAEALNAWCLTVPVCAVADLLGFDEAQLDDIAALVVAFVAALSPLSDDATLARASDAARRLLERMTERVARTRARDGSLVAAVQDAARAAGWQAGGALVTNLVGLLSQTCEASAAWLGNALIAWEESARASADGGRAIPDAAALDAFVAEVGRFDSPVQNTRRFVASHTTIEGVSVDAGAAILVVLAAANRDPAVHREPHRLLPGRAPAPTFGFGKGPHGCPGERIARAVTTGAFDVWLHASSGELPSGLVWDYRASTNIRMPNFGIASQA
ncbi:cytochrome P450 [Burkholderia vietnamiensis]|uniref:cytochrome P450 n=1 Tax=Burkholderia TaxID=32008 RepID=UPI0005D82D80|nr:cytochrome P450 [Burkholderia vietnamiensis]AJY03420.1 cytochrome P450 family protein [Burkholderia vietnamiensis LMG 10929]AOK43870.1 cytochrome [Burkholderia vietnamiensis]AVR12799.1 cytochrome P450 [Burkholderia vietnamiensis]KVG02878.1 cytochrome [Burkholderia vietnamiensis]KVM55501.1 cytochrome [Burkholderia vietnamiensis]